MSNDLFFTHIISCYIFGLSFKPFVCMVHTFNDALLYMSIALKYLHLEAILKIVKSKSGINMQINTWKKKNDP